MSLPQLLVVIGQGYVGLPLAMRAVDAGYDVIGLDLDADRIKELQTGRSFIEDVPNERLEDALATGRYRATDAYADAAGFHIAVISVPTPLRDGVPDLSYVEDAARSIGEHLRPGATVILESTTYPGTTEELVGPILEEASGLAVGQFHLGYSPERIDPGNPTNRLENTPKIISGVDAASLEVVKGFFDRIVETTVPVSSPKEAELAKLVENTFRHVNIALVNELAMFANDLGIDVWEAIDAAATKPFGFMKFTPGPGVGGHCLPIDPSYLSWQVRQSLGHAFRFVELANDINEHMPDYVVQRLMLALNGLGLAVHGRRILLLGLSYKKNTGDIRESPSSAIAQRLVTMGADVHIADPHIGPEDVPVGTSLVPADRDQIESADAAILLVDHDAFDLDLVAQASTYVLDTRNCLSAAPHIERL